MIGPFRRTCRVVYMSAHPGRVGESCLHLATCRHYRLCFADLDSLQDLTSKLLIRCLCGIYRPYKQFQPLAHVLNELVLGI